MKLLPFLMILSAIVTVAAADNSREALGTVEVTYQYYQFSYRV